ncbi:MAG: hypothetical protein WC729_08175 [Sphingomonas sp.]|uniref:hypothetical protein n=1 Tax=Sphingomonas sp. TaxID=28214 RepID=UPI0035699AE9
MRRPALSNGILGIGRFGALAALAGLWSSAAIADVIPPKVMTMTPTGISISDASYNYNVTDLSIGTLTLERFYHMSPGTALDPDAMFNGMRTSNNFDIFVTPNYVPATGLPFNIPAHSRPIVHMGSAASGVYRQTNFTTTPTVIPNSGEAENGVLQFVSASTYIYTDQSGTVYTFNPAVPVVGVNAGVYSSRAQRIGTIAYPDGRVRSFSYNASGQLKMVADSTGYAIVFDYGSTSSSDMKITAACGFDLSQNYVTASSTCSGATLKVAYGYTGNLLTSVVDVTGQTTSYAYSSAYVSTYLSCITPPGYSTCKVANNYPNGQTLVQTHADGSVWTVYWGSVFQQDEDFIPSDGDNQTNLVDPAGKTSTFYFTGSTPYTATDAVGNTTSYRYTGAIQYDSMAPATAAGSILTEVTLPEGNKYLAENYGPYTTISKQTFQAKPGSGLADTVVLISYSCPGGTLTPTCTKPITKTDAKGNVTNLDYYAWGGIKSEMQPAPTAGAARPLKLSTYVQKYPYIKNSGGSLVAGPNQLWVPDTETLCQTVAGSNTPTCDSGAPITVTTFEYGANGTADNLLVRGKVVTSGGVSLRTCFGYDAQSNKIWETSPRGTTSAVCS